MSFTGNIVLNLFEDRALLSNSFGKLETKILPQVGMKFYYGKTIYEINFLVFDLEKNSADVHAVEYSSKSKPQLGYL